LAGPGIPHGESRALTYLYDLYPTLASLCGVDPPQGLEGRDLSPVLHGATSGVRDTLFTAYEDKMRAVRDARYKLIRYPRIGFTQLFDLQDDPHEIENLADSEAQREVLARLRADLAAWQARTGDALRWTIAEPESMEVDLTGRRRQPDGWQPEWIVEKYFGK
jgi:arylsulfatase A-like enzyme